MGNRTSTCLMYDSSHDKMMVLLNFAFKCSLVNETSTTALVQAGTQANQLASATDHTGNIASFTKNRTSKGFFFFSRLKGDIFVSVIKRVYQGNIPFMKTIHTMYVFIKGIIGKTNCYWHMHFFFDLY